MLQTPAGHIGFPIFILHRCVHTWGMFPRAGQLKRRGIDSQKAEIAVRSSLCDERKQAHQPVSGPPPPLDAGASPRTPGTVGGCAPTHFHRRHGYLRPTTRGGRWGPTAAAGSAGTPAAAAPACRCGRAYSVTSPSSHFCTSFDSAQRIQNPTIAIVYRADWCNLRVNRAQARQRMHAAGW